MIKWDDLLVDGKYISPSTLADRCYLGLFKSSTLDSGEWELGAVGMKDHYIVFDLEVKVDKQFNPPREYRSIGIASKNPDDVIKQIHYNTSYVGYQKDPYDVSYSIAAGDDPKPKGNAPKWMILVIAISCALILLLSVSIICKKCKKK